jgi:hypothetical protein
LQLASEIKAKAATGPNETVATQETPASDYCFADGTSITSATARSPPCAETAPSSGWRDDAQVALTDEFGT